MTNKEVIDWLNSYQQLKDANIEIEKIRFYAKKDGTGRRIEVWAKGSKRKFEVSICDSAYTKLGVSMPLYCRGLLETDKEYWQNDIRIKILHVMFWRFWPWLKQADFVYNKIVKEYTWEPLMFSEKILDVVFMRQYYGSEANIEKDMFDKPLEELIELFNKDVEDGLYENLCNKIEYPKHDFKWKTTEELLEDKHFLITF